MVQNRILHCDMKAANLLVSNLGLLQVADFGLAGSFDPNPPSKPLHLHMKLKPNCKYMKCIVTCWYCPSQLLLGVCQYSGEVDMQGIGCVCILQYSTSHAQPQLTQLAPCMFFHLCLYYLSTLLIIDSIDMQWDQTTFTGCQGIGSYKGSHWSDVYHATG